MKPPQQEERGERTTTEEAALLTEREYQVALFLTRGLRNRQIAAALEIEERTVDKHVEHIMRKLGVRSRAQVAAWAAQHPPRGKRLSPRERTVAALVARGLSSRQIARELMVSEHTVDKHVEHIMRKLGVHSRAQIAAWVVEYRLTTHGVLFSGEAD